MNERPGYVKIYRRILDWKYYRTDLATKVVWLHILLTANYKDYKVGRTTIQAGTLICTMQELADETGTSYRQVRSAIDRLKDTGEITVKRSSHKLILTITKWVEYQETKTGYNRKNIKNNTQSSDLIPEEDEEWLRS